MGMRDRALPQPSIVMMTHSWIDDRRANARYVRPTGGNSGDAGAARPRYRSDCSRRSSVRLQPTVGRRAVPRGRANRRAQCGIIATEQQDTHDPHEPPQVHTAIGLGWAAWASWAWVAREGRLPTSNKVCTGMSAASLAGPDVIDVGTGAATGTISEWLVAGAAAPAECRWPAWACATPAEAKTTTSHRHTKPPAETSRRDVRVRLANVLI
jgi:hypothetical protein